MRFLVKVSMPVEACNAAMKEGTFKSTMESILGELRPEAAYFTAEFGVRTGFLIVDMAETSQMPAIAEPFFHAFDAEVDFYPVMLPEDLMKAGPAIEKAVKRYGT